MTFSTLFGISAAILGLSFLIFTILSIYTISYKYNKYIIASGIVSIISLLPTAGFLFAAVYTNEGNPVLSKKYNVTIHTELPIIEFKSEDID